MCRLYPDAKASSDPVTGWSIGATWRGDDGEKQVTGLYFPVYRTRAVARAVLNAYGRNVLPDCPVKLRYSVFRGSGSAGFGMRREDAEKRLAAAGFPICKAA